MLPRQAALRRRAARPAARALSRFAALALAAAALLGAGCGADDEDDGGGDAAAASELTVVLDPDGPGGMPERNAQVSCEEAGDAASCPELEGITLADFEPLPPATACTEIYGGPDLVTISGTLDGEPVEAELTRADGCQIERFDRFSALVRDLFPGYEAGASLAPPG